jgi:NAD(P)-dependent dehydrogenase (short-subunit alcohol dehydrogenase family)
MRARVPEIRGDGERCAVVTGGTGGIGLATCSLLVDRGVRVLTTGSSGETVDRARAELGDGAVVVESDAASTDAIDELVDRARSEFGKVDLLFLNAGIARDLPFEEFDEGSSISSSRSTRAGRTSRRRGSCR